MHICVSRCLICFCILTYLEFTSYKLNLKWLGETANEVNWKSCKMLAKVHRFIAIVVQLIRYHLIYIYERLSNSPETNRSVRIYARDKNIFIFNEKSIYECFMKHEILLTYVYFLCSLSCIRLIWLSMRKTLLHALTETEGTKNIDKRKILTRKADGRKKNSFVFWDVDRTAVAVTDDIFKWMQIVFSPVP